LRSDVIMAQLTSLRTVPGCSPRRIANAIANSSRPGLSRPARSATVQASRYMCNQRRFKQDQLSGPVSADTPQGQEIHDLRSRPPCPSRLAGLWPDHHVSRPGKLTPLTDRRTTRASSEDESALVIRNDPKQCRVCQGAPSRARRVYVSAVTVRYDSAMMASSTVRSILSRSVIYRHPTPVLWTPNCLSRSSYRATPSGR
jgi:hypothetical protein